MSKVKETDLSFYDKEVLLVFTKGKPETIKQLEIVLTPIHATGILRILSRNLRTHEHSLVRSVVKLHKLGVLETVLHTSGQVSYMLTLAGNKILKPPK